MYHVMPGDTLILGGGMFRTVLDVHLTRTSGYVSVKGTLGEARKTELLDMLTLIRHIESGWVTVRRGES